jgi:hypothetical protein
MMMSSRTFRVFVSSTFSDLTAERNALQRFAFPRLRDLAAAHGCRFQAIDLRWGVGEEAALDQQTMKICLTEIERCQQVSPRPNFVILLGDRFGWRPLPCAIPEDEFERILPLASPEEREQLLWREEQSPEAKGWYRRDDNAVPPEYLLQPRQPESRFADYEVWESEVERPLVSALERAALRSGLDEKALLKYVLSATGQEIVSGAMQVSDAVEHVFGFFRKIDNPMDAAGSIFIEMDPELQRRQKELKSRIKQRLPGNIYLFQAHWTRTGVSTDAIGCLPETLENCLKLNESGLEPRNLCEAVWLRLSQVILDEVKKLTVVDPLTFEQEAHHTFGRERARGFVGRERLLAQIAEYLSGKEIHPLVIWGPPGSGKSALLAKAVQQAKRLFGDRTILIARFAGATPESTNGRVLLKDLCRQISHAYNADEVSIPFEFRDLVREFPKRLALATAEKPLVIFLDALDQISEIDCARGLAWLPESLPPSVRLVVSTLPGEGLEELHRKMPVASMLEVTPMNLVEGGQLLKLWLAGAHRTLTDIHRSEILTKFRLGGGLPLYLKLAFDEARHWHSYDDLIVQPGRPPGLSADIPGMIQALFSRLEQESRHGKVLVSHVLGYLAAARNGLSEDEILDVLWQEDVVRADFFKRSPKSPQDITALPVVVWARLSMDLEPYLAWRKSDGTIVLGFYHPQMTQVVQREYLNTLRHTELATYFSMQPLYMAQGNGVPNLRKLSEQVHQLVHAGMWLLLQEILTDLRFIDAKWKADMVRDLLSDYEMACTALPEVSGNLEEFRTFVRSHFHQFAAYKGMALSSSFSLVFSLAANEGSPSVRQQAQTLVDQGLWKSPWLEIKPLWDPTFQPMEPIVEAELDLVEKRVFNAGRYWAMPQASRLVFVTQKRGLIEIIDRTELNPKQSPPLLSHRENSSPLGLFASPDARYLAVVYQDSSGILFQIDQSPTGEYKGYALIQEFRYRLPQYERPVLAFAQGRLWYQGENGQINTLDLPGQIRKSSIDLPPPPGPSSELSGTLETGDALVLTWRVGRDSIVWFLQAGKSHQIESILASDITSVCTCGAGYVAVALSNHQIVVYRIDHTAKCAAHTSSTDLVEAMAFSERSNQLYWNTPKGFYTWKVDGNMPSTRMDGVSVHSLLVGVQALTITGPDEWLIANTSEIAIVRKKKALSQEAPVGEFRMIFAAGDTYVAAAHALDKNWVVDARRKRMLEILSSPKVSACADYNPISNRFLSMDFSRGGKNYLVDLDAGMVKSVPGVGQDICDLAADPSGGFWIADNVGGIHFYNSQDPAVQLIRETDKPYRIRSFSGHEDWLTWAGLRDDVNNHGTIIVFYRIRRQGKWPQLDRIGERVFSPEDAELEAQSFFPNRDAFFLKFSFSIHSGTAMDFTHYRERRFRVSSQDCIAAVTAPDNESVYLLIGDELRLIIPAANKTPIQYTSLVPFCSMAETQSHGQIILAAGIHPFSCKLMEGGK